MRALIVMAFGLFSHVCRVATRVALAASGAVIMIATAQAEGPSTTLRAVYSLELHTSPSRAEQPFGEGLDRQDASGGYRLFSLGTFEVTSDQTPSVYALRGFGSVDAGVFGSWKGWLTSEGKLTGRGPVPVAHTFTHETKVPFKDTEKKQLVMSFTGAHLDLDRVSPAPQYGDKRFPVTPDQLRSVVDPMSAMVELTRENGGPAQMCNKQLRLFDGKERYDIALEKRRDVRVPKVFGQRDGLTAVLCKAKYTPVSGHRLQSEAAYKLAESNRIEVLMVHDRETAINVPYKIQVPTSYGDGVAVVTRFSVERPGQAPIVLVNRE